MTSKSDKFFGGAIKIHREGRGWSKNEFAQKLRDAGLENFHPTTVTRLEDGTRATRLNEAAIIAKVLEHSIDSLVNFTYPYEDLEEAIIVYDYACKRLAWHQQAVAEAFLRAELDESDLALKLASGEIASESERELSAKAIEHFNEIVTHARPEYWEEKLDELDDDDFFDLHYEAIRESREAKAKAASNGND